MATTLTQINIASQKSDVEAEYTALVTGMTANLPDVTSILMTNTTYTKTDLIARFQSRIDATEATKTARTALHLAVANERALDAQVAPLRSQMKAFLALRFGKNSPQMQKFGFTQAKIPQRPVAAKAKGVLTAAATREARGTTGKKQKSKIKGTAVTTAPSVTTAAQPSPTASAAPAAPKPVVTTSSTPTVGS